MATGNRSKLRRRGFFLGLSAGWVVLSITLAAVPIRGRVTNDTTLYDSLSEIRGSRESRPNFDGDIARLSGLEKNYQEKLPALSSVKPAMKRISELKYKAGTEKSAQPFAKKSR